MKQAEQFLKITGVIMLVFGVLGVLIYAAGLAAVIGVTYVTKGVFSGSADLVGMGLLLAAAVAELVAGSLGVRAAKKPEQAGKGLILWGGLTLLLTLAGIALIALRSDATWWKSALGLAAGVVVPVVYRSTIRRIYIRRI